MGGLILVVTWTSNWHELIFKNVRYELVSDRYELLYERGQLYLFLILGCELAPLIVAGIMIIYDMSKEWVVRLRRQIALMSLILFAVFGLSAVFFMKLIPLPYNIAGPAGMLLADFFVLRFWGQEGFHPETASMQIAFDNLTEGVIILDGTMQLKSYNDAAKRIFPELEPSLINHNIKRLYSIPLELFEDYEKKEIDLGNRHYEVLRFKVQYARETIRG